MRPLLLSCALLCLATGTVSVQAYQGAELLDDGRSAEPPPSRKPLNLDLPLSSNHEIGDFIVNLHFHEPSHSWHRNSHALLNRLHRAVKQDGVASLSQQHKYDSKGNIGFCFGRALAAQLLARLMGVSHLDIRKVAVVGKLSARNSERNLNWIYHIATAVRSSENVWRVIDPIFNRPLLVHEWINLTKSKWDRDDHTVYYGLPAEVLVPNYLIGHHEDPKRDFPSFNVPHTAETLYRVGQKEGSQAGVLIHKKGLFGLGGIQWTKSKYNGFFVDLANQYRRVLAGEASLSRAGPGLYEEEDLDWQAPAYIQEEDFLLMSPLMDVL